MAWDAVVIGSGPNGLAAAITLARAGHSVMVYEAQAEFGGGSRSAGLTLPGFVHDVCSAIHPMAATSPFFSELPLDKHGLDWIQPAVPLAHPLDDGSAVLLERSIEATAEGLGRDGKAWRSLFGPLVNGWETLKGDLLGPLRLPRHPFAMARFGLSAMRSGYGLARETFAGERARALFAGVAAHSILPLEAIPSAAFGLVLATAAHAVGWPLARGGSQNIANALASYLRSLGGEIETGHEVKTLDELPPSRTVLCDLSPRQLLKISGRRFPLAFRRKLARYRYGPGVFKVDWALDGPIPWRAADCLRAATVHVGGSLEEIAAAERSPWRGQIPGRPHIILAQQSLFDPSRAPGGRHTAWGYCHVPNGCAVDMTGRIEAQIERFAPGFRDRILARSVLPPDELERRNANLAGGDIAGGANTPAQLFTRPTRRLYSTPDKRVYICSASTPPGGGVHGMCGYFAARAALKTCFG